MYAGYWGGWLPDDGLTIILIVYLIAIKRPIDLHP
jgi:hypothetical protein